MPALKLLLTRIIPFATLLCFVCFGITIVFNVNNLTYLTQRTINGQTMYYFDFIHYIDNVDIEILQRATDNVIDTTPFQNIIDRWEELWADGYDVGDIVISIINGFTFIANIVILLINLILLIPKLIAGILLTALSLMGINIDNEQSIILTGLNTFLDISGIPMINTWL